ncbi:hypothetical protein WJX82_007392 [Trebouxia sp. C0006]
MSEAVGPLASGQRLSLTGSAVPANLDNSGSSGQQLVRVSKTNQAGYDVIPLDVAKVTGNPDLDKFLPGIPSNDDVEGGVRGAVGGILLEPLQWHQLLTPRGWKRLTTEGHTFADAILTVAMAQIGQVMLVWPHQMYLTGITAGVILMVASGWFNIWSMWILVIFYMERKNKMIKEGTWWEEGGVRRTVSQLHEVVVASSGNLYSIDNSHSKRTYELAFGAALVCFSFVPTFRHFRMLNVIGLIGTTFTEWYIFGAAINHGIQPGYQNGSPRGLENFFIGVATLASGGHSNCLEMMDSMQDAGKYDWAFGLGFMYSYILTVPHSIAINLAYPTEIALQDNVYGVLPITAVKKASVSMMIFHQFIAWSLYVNPLLYMWEKAIHTHKKPYWIRLPSRLPAALLIWFIGVLFPFYSTINSFFSAITGPFIGFAIPCLLFNWYYRTPERRANCPVQPSKFWGAYGWKPLFAVNIGMTLLYLVCEFGFGVVYNIKSIIQNVDTFGVFPDCYQCAVNA